MLDTPLAPLALPTCPTCGRSTHASESNDDGVCVECLRAIGVEPITPGALVPSAKPIVEEIDWLGRDEAIVTWSFEHGPPITCAVTVEYEPADPSVGIMSGGFLAHGDAPRTVLDDVAEDAAHEHDVDDDYDRDEYDDYDRDDGYRYADESQYEGGNW